MRRTGLIVAALAVAACARVELSASEAEAIGAAAQSILADRSVGVAAADELPPVIAALNPKSVRVAPEGVYIETRSFFVQSTGLFVPRDSSAFKPKPGSDPEVVHIHGVVYSFSIRG